MAHNKAPTPVPAPRLPVAGGAAPQWFVTRHGKTVGPVTAEVVTQHVADGSLLPSTLVWREGFGAWTPVRDVAEFAPALPRPRLVVPESAFFNVPDAPVAAPLPSEATRLILVQAGLGRRRAQHVVLGVLGACCVAVTAYFVTRPGVPPALPPPVQHAPPQVSPPPRAPPPPPREEAPRVSNKPPRRGGTRAPLAATPPARVRLDPVEVESAPQSNSAHSDAIRQRLEQGPARPPVQLPELEVQSTAMRGVSPAEVERVVQRARRGMERCVQRAVKTGGKTTRAMTLQLHIRADGRVARAGIAGATALSLVEQCVVDTAFGLRFPGPGAAGLDVDVPLRLRAR